MIDVQRLLDVIRLIQILADRVRSVQGQIAALRKSNDNALPNPTPLPVDFDAIAEEPDTVSELIEKIKAELEGELPVEPAEDVSDDDEDLVEDDL